MVKPIMILGTASGVGKSTVTIGLCRLLKRMGYSVAPFKSQNMSNNAHCCPNGEEMARSQAIAAYACGLAPHSDMNPVLLKYGHGIMEVIVQGHLLDAMNSAAYSHAKGDIWTHILDSYQRLAARYEALVMEGAGSPVEMNLKSGDIVNMSMAEKVDAPVLLTADIDRGGVYASVYGTLQLFTTEERARVKGIIINRCKGSPAFFADVKPTMEKITGVPVLGMMPYLPLTLEDEDSLIDPATGAKPAQTAVAMEEQFDFLADSMDTHLDIAQIVHIMGLEAKSK